MNNKILVTLEFDQIKAQVSQSLSTSQGQAEMQDLAPITDRDRIQKWFAELVEFGNIVQENGPVPLANTADLTEILRRIELDASLASQEFAKIKKVLRLANLIQFLLGSKLIFWAGEEFWVAHDRPIRDRHAARSLSGDSRAGSCRPGDRRCRQGGWRN